MANNNTLGILINMNVKQATKALISIDGKLDSLNKKNQKNNQNNQQAIANLVDGLSFVKGAMDSLIAVVDQFGNATRTAFIEAESALTDINITIGRTGRLMDNLSSDDREFGLSNSLSEEFKIIKDTVGELARNTEFSYKEIGMLFKTLKQSGLSTETVLKKLKLGTKNGKDVMNSKSILEATLAFASASRGALTLDEAAKTLILSSNSLNTELSGIEKNADRMIRMVNSADVSFRDLQIMMESLSGAGKGLFSESSPEQLITLLSALKTAGKSPAQAGQYLVGFGRSLNNLMSDFLKQEEYLKGKDSFFARKSRSGDNKGKLTAPAQRRAVKMFALARLGLTKESFLDDETGQLRPMLDIMTKLRAAASKAVSIPGTYKDLTGREIDAGRALGAAEALALIYKSLGTQEAVQLVQATEMLENRLAQANAGKEGYDSSMEAFAKNIGTTNKDALRAQQTALKDNIGVTKLLQSAMFSLNMRIGEVTGSFDTFQKKVAKNVISAFDALLRGSEGVTGMLGTMIIGLKGLAWFAGAAAASILALGMLGQVHAGIMIAQAAAGAELNLATGALATGSQTIGVYLAKIVPLISPLLGAVALITILSGVLFKLSTEAENSWGWVGESLSSAGDSFEKFAQFYLPVLIGKTLYNDDKFVEQFKKLDSESQDTVGNLLVLAQRMRDFFGSVFDGITQSFSGLMSVIFYPIKMVIEVWGFLFSAVNAVTGSFETFFTGVSKSKGIDNLNKALEKSNVWTERLGVFVGWVAGFYLTYWTVLGSVKTVQIAYNIVLKSAGFLQKAFAGALKLTTKWSIISAAWTKVKATAMGLYAVATASATLSSLAFAAVLIIGVGLLVYLGYVLSTAEEGSWQFRAALIAVVLIGAVLLVYLVAAIAGLFGVGAGAKVAAAGGFTMQAAFWPVVLTIAAVVTVVGLLAYGIYKLLSWMGLLGDESENVGASMEGLGDRAMAVVKGGVPKLETKTGKKASGFAHEVEGGQAIADLLKSSGGKLKLDPMLKGIKIPTGGIEGLQLEGGGLKLPEGVGAGGASGFTTGATYNVKVEVATNVQQLDPKTVKTVARQLAPVIAQHIRRVP